VSAYVFIAVDGGKCASREAYKTNNRIVIIGYQIWDLH